MIKSKSIKYIIQKILPDYVVAMETYCVSCKKYTTNENSSAREFD